MSGVVAVLENQPPHYYAIEKMVNSIDLRTANLWTMVTERFQGALKPVRDSGQDAKPFAVNPAKWISALNTIIRSLRPAVLVIDLGLTREEELIFESLKDIGNLDSRVDELKGIQGTLLAFRLIIELQRENCFIPIIVFSQYPVPAERILTRLTGRRSDILFCHKPDFPHDPDAVEDALLPVLKRCLDFSAVVDADRSMFAQVTHDNLSLYEHVVRIAHSNDPVLIIGETGIGKSRIAKVIHQLSPKSSQAFLSLDVSIHKDSDKARSEWMGHQKGSFTGAVADRRGLLLEADHGTVFFDEINSFALPLQTILLRLLETKQLSPVGGPFEDNGQHSDWNGPLHSRFIFASNQPLIKLVQEDSFREDLYYRMNVHRLELKPLRDRKIEIPTLLAHFVGEFRSDNPAMLGMKEHSFSNDDINAAQAYEWPGNVRQLRSLVRRSLWEGISIRDAIETERLDGHPRRPNIRGQLHVTVPSAENFNGAEMVGPTSDGKDSAKRQARAFADLFDNGTCQSLNECLDEFILKPICQEVLTRSKLQKEAAKKLGISVATLNRYLRKK
jgi:DNA-binding NtrC family response regulator